MSLTLSIPFSEYSRAAFDHALTIIDTLAPAQPEPIQSVLIGLATADLATLLDEAHSEALTLNDALSWSPWSAQHLSTESARSLDLSIHYIQRVAPDESFIVVMLNALAVTYPFAEDAPELRLADTDDMWRLYCSEADKLDQAPCSHIFPRHTAACRKCGKVTLTKFYVIEPSYFHDGDYADLMGLATIPRNDLRLLHWAIGGGTL